ncbi:hypothetical protein ACFRJ8_14745 [Arthrobacter sp. NPDC056886]|uniref:phage major capsid protein n=1 Tax=Arthrobacter sp. NPDC056886 TaxID=3345960 RepID=UPI0036716ABC
MAYSYPPVAPTFSGDNETISRFLNSPSVVARRVQDISANRFIADVLLTGRTDVSGGAITYDVDEDLYTVRPVTAVSAGGEYDLTTLTNGTPQVAKVTKWGQDTEVTDEAIKRQNFAAVEKGLGKLSNSVIKKVDSISLSLIAATVTQTQTVTSGQWSVSGTAAILRDIMLAKAKVTALNKGYDPNVLVVDDITWAYLASDSGVMNARGREDSANSIYTGNFPTIAGLTILPTPNIPGGSGAWLIDTAALGGIADEDLGGDYAKAGALETKVIREDLNDKWRLRARRVCVPYVTEPGAAIKITGI